jgi:hypothetical protein
VSAAALFIFAEHAVSDRQRFHFASMGVLAVLAAVISGSVVLQRNADTQSARLHSTQSTNLPRAEAKAALDEAKEALKTAEAGTKAECSSGRGPKCLDLERREAEARQRVETKRSEVVKLGAQAAESSTASVLGDWAPIFDRGMVVAPAIWLELAAPALLAFGFAPLPNRLRRQKGLAPETVALQSQLNTAHGEIERLQEALRKARRRKRKEREPRKPAGSPAKPAKAPPSLKLVAANDR